MRKYLDFRSHIDEEKLKEYANIIKKDGIVVFPTETVYGVATNGLNKEAVEKLYKIKKRQYNKPISLLVSDLEMIESITKDITDIEYKLIKEFLPGPLTIVLKKNDKVPDIVTSNGDTVGIRISENEIARKIVKYANVPIALTSANISGKSTGVNINQIISDFKDNVDYYIDGGECQSDIGSTIVKVCDGVPHILRKGPISEENIKKVINELQ